MTQFIDDLDGLKAGVRNPTYEYPNIRHQSATMKIRVSNLCDTALARKLNDAADKAATKGVTQRNNITAWRPNLSTSENSTMSSS